MPAAAELKTGCAADRLLMGAALLDEDAAGRRMPLKLRRVVGFWPCCAAAAATEVEAEDKLDELFFSAGLLAVPAGAAAMERAPRELPMV